MEKTHELRKEGKMKKIIYLSPLILLLLAVSVAGIAKNQNDKLTICEAKIILLRDQTNQQRISVQTTINNLVAKLKNLKSKEVDKILEPYLTPKKGEKK